ncbi:MAG: hypothetical protein LBQ74_05165 [Prevotella sp.]|jgi:hypothetical protein|nr:hypothetical protein [Prevotella sp.]
MLQITTTDKQVFLQVDNYRKIPYYKGQLRFRLPDTGDRFHVYLWPSETPFINMPVSKGVIIDGVELTYENMDELLEDIAPVEGGGGGTTEDWVRDNFVALWKDDGDYTFKAEQAKEAGKAFYNFGVDFRQDGKWSAFRTTVGQSRIFTVGCQETGDEAFSVKSNGIASQYEGAPGFDAKEDNDLLAKKDVDFENIYPALFTNAEADQYMAGEVADILCSLFYKPDGTQAWIKDFFGKQTIPVISEQLDTYQVIGFMNIIEPVGDVNNPDTDTDYVVAVYNPMTGYRRYDEEVGKQFVTGTIVKSAGRLGYILDTFASTGDWDTDIEDGYLKEIQTTDRDNEAINVAIAEFIQ